MKMKKVLTIGLSAAMIAIAVPGNVYAAEMPAEFSDHADAEDDEQQIGDGDEGDGEANLFSD